MSIGAGPQAAAAQREEQKASMLMTVVFFIIGVSVILAYEWGAPTPQFRPDAPNIILFGVLVASILFIAARYGSQTRLHRRLCMSCGRAIPSDALYCPYCGVQFPRT